jgi:serine phosphatase RsbU (regulator of sigma subunit)
MYIEIGNLILLLLSIFAGATCFYAAIVGFSFEGYYGRSYMPFVIIGLIAAWYSIWSGIRNTEILNQYTFIVSMSTLFTGFMGPSLYLLSVSAVNIYKKINSKLYWLLLFGLFSFSFSIAALVDIDIADLIQQAYIDGKIYTLGIWAYMFYCHVIELVVFTLLSLFLIIRTLASKTKTSREKTPAKLVLSAIIIAVFSISLSAVLPFFNPDSILVKFGPVVTLPIIIIAYISTVQSRNLQKKAFELEKRYEVIEQQLRIARLMQSKLLPPREHNINDITIFATYLPMEKVGGDFYDVNYNDTSLMVFIADVSGHGIPGAFMATISKILFKQITENYKSPSQVLDTLNSQMLEYIVEGNFLTAFHGFIDFKSKELVFTCAGHVPALIYRKDSDTLYELPVNGSSIGWHKDNRFSESSFQLQPGDRIILYTDGIIECFNDEREMYGVERFKIFVRTNHNLSGEVLSKLLITELKGFMAGDTFDDDITLVIIDIP